MADQDNIDFLKHQRNAYKGKVTGFSNTILERKDDLSESELQSILYRLRLTYEKFDDSQTALEKIDKNERQTTDARDEFENKYGEVESEIISLVSQRQSANQKLQAQKLNNENGGTSNHIRLPEISIPKFDGSYMSWLNFRDVFLDIVHNNNNVDNLSKFRHLRACTLAGKAFQYIEFIPQTADNYATAWKTLLDQYNNEVQIKKKHMKEIYEIKKVQEGSASSLQTFIDSFRRHFNALKALKTDVDNWDLFLIHHLSERLDNSSRKEIEMKSPFDKALSLDEFLTILSQRARVLSVVPFNSKSNHDAFSKSHQETNSKPSYKAISRSLVTSTTAPSCPICKENHSAFGCKKLTSLSVQKRFELIRALGLCENCFSVNHKVDTCKSGSCRKCQSRHHTLLHVFSSNSSPATNVLQSPVEPSRNGSDPLITTSTDSSLALNSITESNYSAKSTRQILLATALIWVQSSAGNRTQCRALLDTGSQLNFITEHLSQTLKAPKQSISIPVTGICHNVTQVRHQVNLTISSRVSDYTASLNFLVLPRITGILPSLPVRFDPECLPSHIQLADPLFYHPDKIDMLIGAELYFDIVYGNSIQIINELPPFHNSEFGYLIAGKTHGQYQPSSTALVCSLDELSSQIQKFWQLEQINSVNNFSIEEKSCEEHYSKNVTRDSTGRYSVALPLKSNISELGESSSNSLRQFLYLERRFVKNPEVREQYIQFMNEYINLHHMHEVIDQKVTNTATYYLPHHAVVKDNSTTTKLRVVFNASSKTSSGISLNDALMNGPTIQQDLFSMIVRFRKHHIAFTADIAKMYRQIEIHHDHRDLQRIWWREAPDQPIKSYRLGTVTYGTASAPFLAIRTLHQLSLDEQQDFPQASKILSSDFYVDDLLSGATTEDEAKLIQSQLNQLLVRGGFELRKWSSNYKAMSTDTDLQNELTSVLGVLWNTESDNFEVSLGKINFCNKITKRFVLAEIGQLFDPLGLCAPVVFFAKLFMQSLWSNPEITWDTILPNELHNTWEQFRHQLAALQPIRIPRCVIPNCNVKFIELHGFGDASRTGYGCCVYIRTTDQDNNHHIRLLCSKSRVAPMRTQTIPRLELCAALLLAQLMQKVQSIINIPFNQTFFWSDSEITIFRIKSAPAKYATFVANRISHIQELSSPDNWRYVPTDDNPADIVSRGLMPNQLQSSSLWWTGPSFLSRDSENWPAPVQTNIEETEYRKPEPVSNVTTNSSFPLINKFSDYVTLLKITALCFRFINNCRNKRQNSANQVGPITIQELDTSLKGIVKSIQNEEFHMKAILGNSSYTSDDLTTIVIQIEGCLNSRPLTPMSEDPSDLNVLTPGHFLIGEALTSVPDPTLLKLDFNRLARYQRLQYNTQLFWQRWSNEYLSELQQHHKWFSTSIDFQIGSMVLIKEDNIPPMKWILGRIIATHPGKDGHIRVVTIRTTSGEFKRAITRICLLPIDDTTPKDG